MNPLFAAAYVGIVFFLFHILTKDELVTKLSPKHRAWAFLGCIVFPALFFLPYILDFPAPKIELPGWLYWGPFFLLALVGLIIQLFYPEREKQATPIFFISVLVIVFIHNLMPLILSLLSRVWR